jgi:hypothetical protein
MDILEDHRSIARDSPSRYCVCVSNSIPSVDSLSEADIKDDLALPQVTLMHPQPTRGTPPRVKVPEQQSELPALRSAAMLSSATSRSLRCHALLDCREVSASPHPLSQGRGKRARHCWTLCRMGAHSFEKSSAIPSFDLYHGVWRRGTEKDGATLCKRSSLAALGVAAVEWLSDSN